MKFICETFLWMCVTFQNKSNESNSIIIDYSDATVTAPNHPLNKRSKNSLATVLLQYHSFEVSFVIRLHLISLINNQKAENFSRKCLPNTGTILVPAAGTHAARSHSPQGVRVRTPGGQI